MGVGGTLGTINWFQGEASAFYGLRYKVDEKITIEYEHTTDQMLLESSYLSVRSPWNLGVSYQLNDYVSLSTQYLHGSQISVTAQVITNPARPPLLGGKDLAPVPMRLRGGNALPAAGQARHFSVHERRPGAHGHLRVQATAPARSRQAAAV